jgi:uncharacterized delta-60 repeat protein
MNRTSGPRGAARQRPRVEALEARRLLTTLPAGILDTSFGTEGYVSIPLIPSSLSSTANPTGAGAGAVTSSGMTVLAGSYTNNGTGYFVIEELNANGTPNTSFGTDGLATIAVGSSASGNSSAEPTATSLVVQSDGSIDVAGILSSPTTTNDAFVGLIQVTPTGTLDTSFGSQGMAKLPETDADSEPFQTINALALTSSGQIVVAGDAYITVSGATDPALFAARFDANGTLDSSFGTSGVATIPITVNGNTNNNASAVGVESTGEVILSGTVQNSSSSNESVLVGLTSSGQLDPSFGGSAAGEIFVPVINNLTITPADQILVTGSDSVTRYDANGTIDTTFGTSGVEDLPSGVASAGVTIQSNGQILVAGTIETTTSSSSTTENYALIRLEADGAIDTTFGNSATPGLSIYASSTQSVGSSEATLTSSGQIILNGYGLNTSTDSTTDTTTDTVYLTALAAKSVPTPTPANQLPAADFDGSGQSNIAVYLTASGEFAYRPANGGADVIEQFGIPGLGQTIPAPGDYDGAGKTELGVYLPSVGVYAYRPANGGPDVLESFGIAGAGQTIPAPGDYLGTGVDDIAVYLPSLGEFAIRNPAGGPDQIIPFGSPGIGQSIPVPGDYFGTGQTDIAVYLPAIGAYAVRNPTTGADVIIPFGIPGGTNTIPVPGDFDGSGVTELGVYLPKFGLFIYRPADGAADVIIPFGTSGNGSIPDVGDYDGSGDDDIAIYDPNYASFAYRPVNGGSDLIVPFGTPGIGASLPLAAPISTNVSIALSSSFSSQSAESTTVSAESVAVTTRSTAVPSVPLKKLAGKTLVKIASRLPTQDDPSKPKG